MDLREMSRQKFRWVVAGLVGAIVLLAMSQPARPPREPTEAEQVCARNGPGIECAEARMYERRRQEFAKKACAEGLIKC